MASWSNNGGVAARRHRRERYSRLRCTHRAHPLRRPRDELAALLDGEPSYRANQGWEGCTAIALHRAGSPTSQKRCGNGSRRPSSCSPSVTESVSDGGETVKLLWRLADGVLLESVLMHYRDGRRCESARRPDAPWLRFLRQRSSRLRPACGTGEIVDR